MSFHTENESGSSGVLQLKDTSVTQGVTPTVLASGISKNLFFFSHVSFLDIWTTAAEQSMCIIVKMEKPSSKNYKKIKQCLTKK